MPIRIRDEYGELSSGAEPAAEPIAPTIGEQLGAALRLAIFSHGPVAPGSQLAGPLMIELTGTPGSTVEATSDVHNRQRAAVVLSPRLGAAIDPSGTTWRPTHRLSIDEPIVQPSATTRLSLSVDIPETLEPARFCAPLYMAGLAGSLSVVIEVTGS